jgi:hypothetical protein
MRRLGALSAILAVLAPGPADAQPTPTLAATGQSLVAGGVAAAPDALVDEADELDPVIDFEPGEGLTIRSADGNFTLTTRLRGMLLLTSTIPDGGDAGVDIELRRARVTFQGNVFDPHLRYRMQLAIAPRDMQWVGGIDGHPTRSPLLDWILETRHLRELNVRAGQFVTNFSRERTISSSSMQLVDRSIMNAEFHLDRDIAIEVRSTDFLGAHLFRYYVGIGNGEGRDSLLSQDTAFQYYARVELTPLGAFDDYEQGDLARSSTPRLAFGGGYAFLDRAVHDRGIMGEVPADGGTTDIHLFNADLVFMYQGFSAHAEMTWREGFRNPGGAVDEQTGMPIPIEAARNGLGWFAQAGFLLPGLPIEFAARYGEIRPVGATTSLGEHHELGGGVNWFLHGHALKLQADFFELWDGAAIERGEERIRVQLQAAL